MSKFRDTLRVTLAGIIQVLSLNPPSHPVATIRYQPLCIQIIIIIISVIYKVEHLQPIPRWNNEFYSLYKKPNIVEDIKIRRLKWAGHIIRM
jgi:hypothetical protein